MAYRFGQALAHSNGRFRTANGTFAATRACHCATHSSDSLSAQCQCHPAMPVTFMGHASFCGGTSHRLSIALNLSGLGEDQVAINLRTEQPGDAYKASIPGSWCRRCTSVVPC